MSEEEIRYWLDDQVYAEAIKMWLSEGHSREEIATFLKEQG